MLRAFVVVAVVMPFSLFATEVTGGSPNAPTEYATHFGALSKLSVAVAQAMPPDQYGFRPHPDSMDFGQLMSHIATTNYQFCAGLKDSDPPALPSPGDKEGIVKFLSDSFEYCSTIIPKLDRRATHEQAQLSRRAPHRKRSPAGHVHPRGASSRPSGDLPPRQGYQAALLQDLSKPYIQSSAYVAVSG